MAEGKEEEKCITYISRIYPAGCLCTCVLRTENVIVSQLGYPCIAYYYHAYGDAGGLGLQNNDEGLI